MNIINTRSGRLRVRGGLSLRWAGVVLLLMMLALQLPLRAQLPEWSVTGTAVRSSIVPIYTWYTEYPYTQQLYLASELTPAMANKPIKKIAFKYYGLPKLHVVMDIYMVLVPSDVRTLADGYYTAGLRRVAQSKEVEFKNLGGSSAGDWVEIDLDDPFYWDGTSNIAVSIQQLSLSERLDCEFICHAKDSMSRTSLNDDATVPLRLTNVPQDTASSVTTVLRHVRPHINFIYDNCAANNSAFAFSSSLLISDTITVDPGDPFTKPTLTGPAVGDVVYYTSSNPYVASVNLTTGDVSLTGQVGVTTITAEWQRSGKCAKFAHYVINVVDNCNKIGTNAGTGLLPFKANSGYTWAQMIYKGAEIGQSCRIHSLSFDSRLNDNTTRSVKIYLGRTSKEMFNSETDFVPVADLTLVYTGPLNIHRGWNRFEFNEVSDFDYDMSDNLVVAVATDLIEDPTLMLLPVNFSQTSTADNTCIYAYTDLWRDLPDPVSYDGHWEEFPTLDDAHVIYLSKARPDIDICTYCCKLRTGEFRYDATEAEYAVGTGIPFDAPVLTNTTGDVVNFSSSDETLATVASDGTVTMVPNQTGEAIITATIDADATYCMNNAQYIIRARRYGTLTYVTSNNCTGTASAPPQSQTGLGTVTLRSDVPTCTGDDQVFMEWNTAADGSGDDYYPGGSFPLLGDDTLYAIYGSKCCIADSALLVTYVRNGGERDTLERSPDGYYNFDICQHETLTVRVDPKPGSMCSFAIPEYQFQYANLYMPLTVAGNEFVPPSPYSLTFDSVIGYDLKFTAYGPGSCPIRMPGRIRVSDGIGVRYVADDPFLICPGKPSDISVGYYKNAVDYIRVDRAHPDTRAVDGHVETIFLPDGVECGGSCSYVSSINFYQFRDDAKIRDNNDIEYLKLNIEHSYIGDLLIKLKCPVDPTYNGTADHRREVAILTYSSGASNDESDCVSNATGAWRKWEGNSYYTAAHFGMSIDPSGTIPSNKLCDGTYASNLPGTGWDYVWSWADGYTYAAGNSKVYNTVNHQRIYNNQAWSNRSSGSDRGTHWVEIVKPSNLATKSQIYKPDHNIEGGVHNNKHYDGLIGCPFNGDWSIEVIDAWKQDNGWLFSWELALSEDSLRDVWSYNAELDSTWLACTWPSAKYNDHLVITPDANMTGTNVVNCDIWTVDNFGCYRDSADVPFTFIVREVIINVHDTMADCTGEHGTISIEVPNEYSAFQPFTFYLDPVFEPEGSIDPDDMVDWTAGPTSTGKFFDVPFGDHTVLAIDKDGCPRLKPSDIGRNRITASIVSQQDAECAGVNNGSFTVSATTTQPRLGNVFTYTVAGLGSNTTGVFTNVPAGTYTVNVTDAFNSCDGSVQVIIGTTIPAITLVDDTLRQPMESGCPSANGKYVITATVNGAGPYSYTWHSSEGTTMTPGATTAATPSGFNVRATMNTDGSCGTFYDTLIVTETAHGCVGKFVGSFITIADQPSITLAPGVQRTRDLGCHPNVASMAPTQDSFVVSGGCNGSGHATVTAGPVSNVTDGSDCRKKQYWVATYTTACNQSAEPDTIWRTWTHSDTPKPTFDAMPVVTATPSGNCQYTVPNLSATVLPRSHDACGGTVEYLLSEQSDVGVYTQPVLKNDTLDVEVVVRGTCGDTAHAHVKVVIPRDTVHVMTDLSTTTNKVEASACTGQRVDVTTFVTQPNGSEHVYWTSDPAGFTHTDPTYPVALGPDTVYQAVVVDGNGCSDTAKVTIHLNPSPVITLADGSGAYEQSICEGQSITPIKVKLENSTYNPASPIGSVTGVTVDAHHHGDKPDTVFISGKPEANGEYWLKVLSDQTPACASDSVKVKFIVTDTIEPSIVTAVGGTEGRDTVCITSAISLTDTLMTISETHGGDGDSWNWTITPASGYTIISGAGTREMTVKWTTAGDYTLKVTVTHGDLNCTSVKSKSIHVQPVPTIDMGSIAGGGDEVTICPNRDTLSFNTAMTGADGTATYTYDYGGDLAFAELAHDSRDTAVTIPHDCGVNYRVGVTVADNHGCSVTDSMTVHAVDNDAPTFTTPSSWGTLVEFEGCNLDTLTKQHPVVRTAAGLLDTLGVTVADNCTTNLTQLKVSSRDSVMTEGVTCGNKIRRYYIVEDLCGNKDSIYEEIYVRFPSGAPTVDAEIPVVQATPAGSCQYEIPDLSATAILRVTGHCGNEHLRVTTTQSETGVRDQSTSGKQTITVTVGVSDTCSAEATVTVKVEIPQDTLALKNNLSLTSNTIDTSACADNTVATTITVLHPNGSEHLYWTSDPAGFSRTDVYSVELNPGTPDTTYQAVLVDGNGCTDTAKIHVDLNPSPVITPVTGSGAYTQDICLGDSIDTIKVEIRYATYDVTSSIGTAERVTVVNHHHDEAGVYDTVMVLGNPKDTNEYWIRVLSDQAPACNKDSVKITFNVADTVQPVIATAVGGVDGKDTVCISSTTSLTNTAMTISETASMVGNEYVWLVDGGTITSGDGTRVITVAWTTEGDKTVTVKVKRGVCWSQASKQIYVQPVPTLTMDNAASSQYDVATNTYPICPNRDTLSFNATLTGADGSATYTYTYGGNGVTFVQLVNDSRDTAKIPHTCGVDYRVGVTVMDNHGCSVTDSMTISAIDTTAPTVTASGGGKNMGVEDIIGCSSNLNTDYPAMTTAEELIGEGVTLADNCIDPTKLIVSHRDSVYPDVTCGYTIRRYYIVSDSCGNKDSIYQTINVHIAAHAFTITDVRTSVDVTCHSRVRGLSSTATEIVLPTVLDGCGHVMNPLNRYPDSVVVGTECVNTTTFTYEYKDCENHDTSWTFTYNVELPRLNLLDTTRVTQVLPCVSTAHNEGGAPTNLSYTDACGRTVNAVPVDADFNPTVNGSGDPVSLPIDNVDGTGNGTVTYNWVYEDCAGNRYVWQKVDTIRPNEFTAYTPDSLEVHCIGNIELPPVPVREVCDVPVPFYPPYAEPDTNYNIENGCYAVTYSIEYEVFAQTYTYNYVYVYNPPDFTVPDPVVIETTHCLADVHRPDSDDLPVVTHNYRPEDATCATGLDDTVHFTGPDSTFASNGCVDTVTFTYHYADCRQDKVWYIKYILKPADPPHEIENEETHSYASTVGATQCFDSCVATKDTIWGATLPIIVSECGDTIPTPVPTYADTLTDADHDAVTGWRTYHYVYTDCTGENTYEWTYRFNVSRHTDPHQVPPDPSDPTSVVDSVNRNLQCIGDVVAPTLPTVVDVCGNVLSPTGHEWVVRTDHGCKDTVTYYYNYYDPSYNEAAGDDSTAALVYHWYYRYYIDRSQIPTVVQGFNPDHDESDCFGNAGRPTQVPVVVDACNEPLEPEIDSVDTHTNNDPNNCTGNRTYRYKYTDCSGDNTVTLYYSIDIVHPALVIPENDTVDYTCVNAAMAYRPIPDTLTNACGDRIVPDSIGRTETLNVHDTGYVSYHYQYTDCDGVVYDWYYVCDVKPEAFVEPVDSSRTVNCLVQASVPTAAQYPEIVECGVRIPFDRPWDSGPVTTSSGNDTCGVVTYTYTYTIHGQQYDWSFIYTLDPPEFSIPEIDSVDTIECYDVNDPATVPTLPDVVNSCGDTINSSKTNPPTLVIDSSDYVVNNHCYGNVVYNYSYGDCSGDTIVWKFTYVVLPSTPPHEVTNPVTGTMAATSTATPVQCFDSCYADADTIWGATLPIMVTSCGDTLATPVPTYADTLSNAAHDTVTGTRTYHYVYRDCKGNEYDWTYRFDVSRHTNPYELPVDPLNPTVFVDTVMRGVMCDSMAVRPTLPTVVDVCGNVLEPAADSSVVRTNHHCQDTVTYYYNYYDASYIPGTDNPANELAYHWYFRYYIDRTQMPVIVQDVTPNYDTVPCFADALELPPLMPVVVDGCLDTLAPFDTIADTNHTILNGHELCTGSVHYTFRYRDCTGTNILEWEYTRYVSHPLLEPLIPDSVREAYTCVNAALAYEPHPDTLINSCGDTIKPVADPLNPIVSLVHDTGTVIYHYTYTDCDDSVYDLAYVCEVTPEEFHAPDTVLETVNCLVQAHIPTAEQQPEIVVCGDTITWVGGANVEPDTNTSSEFNDTCGVITYTYHYIVHDIPYTWSYVYTLDPPEFTIPEIDSVDTIECYAANDPAMTPTLPDVINSCGDTINSSHTNPPSLVIDSSDYVANGSCHGNIVYNYTYTDCSGDTLVWQFTYVVHHTTAPHIVGTEPDTVSSVACFGDATRTFDVPTVEDVCGRAISTPEPDTIDGGTDCEGWRIYRYTFVDCDSVPFVWQYRYIVHDTVAPHIDVDAMLAMAETQAVARGNCQYSMPNLKDATLQATSDVASAHCESTVFFVEQTPDSLALFHQPLNDSVVTVHVVVRDACNNEDAADVDIVIPGSHITNDVVSIDADNQSSQTAVICAGQSILLRAQASSANGDSLYVWTPTDGLTIANNEAMAAPMQDVQYTVTYTDRNGCTASDVIDVTVHQLTSAGETLTVCDTYTWSNNGSNLGPYTQSGTYYNSYLTADGCASVDTLYLTVNYNSSQSYVVDDACDRYEWNGTTYVNDGVYISQVYYTPENCPSVDTLTLTLLHNTSTAYTDEACDSYTWSRDHQEYLESGTYYYSYNTDAGCPSVDTLRLTVHRSSVTNLSATACDHFEWYGQQFGVSAQAEHHLDDRFGCDSLLRMDITIYYSDNYQYSDTICAGEQYQFFNQTLTESGTFENVIRTVHGCDSTISLYLLVVPRPAVRIGYDYDCKDASYTLTASTPANTFHWYSVPNVEGLAAQASERTITVTPTHHTLFTVLAGYEGLMQCAVSDTISLNPVSVVNATIEANPIALYRELLDWSAIDRTQTETWHQWYVDGIYYGDDTEISGTASDKVDSLVIVLIAGSDQCTDTARVVLPMLREGLFVPNVFTPDLKINRSFGAVGTGIIRFQMDIYNRSGVHVFHSDDIHDWWDGDHNGIPCTNGAYVYRIVYSTEVYPDVKNEVTGQVLLLR